MASETKVSPVEIDTVYVSRWGYDQTNVEFFQVVAATPKTILLREIAQRAVRHIGNMSECVEPLPGEFVGAPFRRKIHPEMRNGVSLTTFSNAYPWDGGAEFQSHYA